MDSLIILIAKDLIYLLILGFLYVGLRLEGARRRQFILTTVVAGVAGVVALKLAGALYSDPRPFVSEHVRPLFAHGADNGFPSDHVSLGALLALIVVPYRRRWGMALLLLALLIGGARVAAHVHHWMDIFGGFAVAALAWGVALGALRLIGRPKAAGAPEA